MKRSNTLFPPSFQGPDPIGTRAYPLAILLCVVLAAGCVSPGKHKAVVAERDSLDRRSRMLEQKLDNAQISNESLLTELGTLLEEFEDERISRATLEGRVAALSAAERRLTSELTYTEVELERSQEELERKSDEVAKLTSTYTNLVSDLESELASGQIQIEQLREGIRVNVSDDVLFASGSATLDSIGRQVLVKVAGQLAKLNHNIEVQGHTDDIPIRGGLTKRFATNWELAAARAARVARLLQEKGVSGDRLVVSSFADNRPLVPNDSAQSRALNRRIEIRLLPVEEPMIEFSDGASAGALTTDDGKTRGAPASPRPAAAAGGASRP